MTTGKEAQLISAIKTFRTTIGTTVNFKAGQDLIIERLRSPELVLPNVSDKLSMADEPLGIAIAISNVHYSTKKDAVFGHIEGLTREQLKFEGYVVWDPIWLYPWFFIGSADEPELGFVFYGLNGDKSRPFSPVFGKANNALAISTFHGEVSSYEERRTKGLFHKAGTRLNMGVNNIDEFKKALQEITERPRVQKTDTSKQTTKEEPGESSLAVDIAKLAFKGAAFGAKLAFKGLTFGAKKAYEYYKDKEER